MGLPDLDTLRNALLQLLKRWPKSVIYIASYILFRTRGTVKFINSKICIYCNLYNALYEYHTYSDQRLQTHVFPQYTHKPGNIYHYIEHF